MKDHTTTFLYKNIQRMCLLSLIVVIYLITMASSLVYYVIPFFCWFSIMTLAKYEDERDKSNDDFI